MSNSGRRPGEIDLVMLAAVTRFAVTLMDLLLEIVWPPRPLSYSDFWGPPGNYQAEWWGE